MQRYFASKNSDYEGSKLRMDAMLDGRQRSESFARVLSQAIAAKVAVGDGSLPTNSASPTAGTDPTGFGETDAKALAEALSTTVADSPFDQLQRARSFYNDYAITLLRLFGTDSRVLNVDEMDPIGAIQAMPKQDKEPNSVTTARAEIERAINLEDTFRRSASAFAKETIATREDVIILLTSIDGAKTAQKKLKPTIEGSGNDPGLRAQVASKSKELTRIQQELKDLNDELTELRADLGRTQRPRELEVLRAKIRAQQDRIKDAMAKQDGAKGDLDAATKLLQQANKDLSAAEFKEQAASRTVIELIFAESNRLAKAAIREIYQTPTATQPSRDSNYRLVLLLLQVHVEPGNKADQVAAIRLTSQCKDVRVLYVSPTRTYDLDDQRRVDIEQTAISATLAATIPGKGSGQIDADRRERDEERGRYLSRVSKTNSFVEAGDNETRFGWYFYPSNVVVEKHWGG